MYAIKSWSKVFESSYSRKLKRLDWYQTPAGVESNGCIELISRGADGLVAMAVFGLLCQWTATHPQHQRGKLCRTDGRPLSVSQIATHIRVDLQTTVAAIELLTSPEVGWIEEVEEGATAVFRSTHDDDLPPARNPAMDYGTPERLPVDTSGPIPFGLSVEAIETADMLRVEEAFLKAWHSRPGVAPVSGVKMAAATVRVFRERCFEPGWLAQAEAALKVIPPPYHVGTKKLFPLKALIDDPESALLIATGSKYGWDGKKETTSKPADKSVGTTSASQKVHDDSVTKDKAKADRERTYRARLAEKWGADAGLLTDKEVADLDAKQPMRGLYGILIAANKRTAREVHKRLYTATLHEVMEIDAGGLSFAETEAQHKGAV